MVLSLEVSSGYIMMLRWMQLFASRVVMLLSKGRLKQLKEALQVRALLIGKMRLDYLQSTNPSTNPVMDTNNRPCV